MHDTDNSSSSPSSPWSEKLESLWDEQRAASLDSVARLVYRSNLLGSDQRVTNTGGGNTSSKLPLPDPLSGQDVDVLYVKGSGGDLRTSTAANFASLHMDKLLALRAMYQASPDKGVKTPLEDSMVAMYPHCVYNLNPRASSIDTPLHGFVPHRHVDHSHPQAVIAIAAAADQEALVRDIYGDRVAWVAWQRPGFDLGLVMQRACEANPQLEGIVMGQHGLINWHDDDRACYQLSLSLINQAAAYLAAHDQGDASFGGQRYPTLDSDARHALLVQLLPRLRGMLSRAQRFIATVQSDEATLQFINSHDAPRLAELGTSCPDHFLRTKIKPLYVAWQPDVADIDGLLQLLEQGLEAYRHDYANYYAQHRHPDSPAMRDPNPTVILIPGIGMVAWGKNKSESRVTAEFYRAAIAVMRGAESVSRYAALPTQEAFDIEYWQLEEAKLQRMPPDKTFARHVVVVIGAGSGIGKAVAQRVAPEGAHVVCADVNLEAAQACADALIAHYGAGIGVAGSGISGCGQAIAVAVDIRERSSVKAMLEQTVLAYGGIDSIIVTAGVFVAPDASGHIADDKWRFTFDVNVMGSYLVADEAAHIWRAQGLSGSLVLTSSANAVVAKRGSLAYDSSKAAANHLMRELAIELAPLVRVNALAPATVVEGSAMFPRERVISSLQKYGLGFADDESTEALRDKLAAFYAERTLTKAPISLADQAEAAYILASPLLSKTTGQVLAVDGGLVEALLR